ncbi:hypothetical protein C3486_05915 [Streptomyces sp. Ru73]|uniref:hypothetical protein n=1 Tax=Streptomyces sp. Ru73 TaxID=2080748 RepID=UPI000CDD5762|nr:hypothetical protein [Streptomyces sp. Ru73]POX42268.1 hypothetical protein C3486_05915 [Streptomyces sp. Ru73]
MHTLDVRAPLHVPYLTPGDVVNNARTATGWLPPLPPARELVYYGGLGALAVAGALEWPVALAVGGATVLIQRSRRQEPAERAQPAAESGPEQAAQQAAQGTKKKD